MRLSARLRNRAFPGRRVAAVLACCVLLHLAGVARGATLVIHVLSGRRPSRSPARSSPCIPWMAPRATPHRSTPSWTR